MWWCVRVGRADANCSRARRVIDLEATALSNLANVIVGDVIKSYRDRAAFEAAVDELRGRSR